MSSSYKDSSRFDPVANCRFQSDGEASFIVDDEEEIELEFSGEYFLP